MHQLTSGLLMLPLWFVFRGLLSSEDSVLFISNAWEMFSYMITLSLLGGCYFEIFFFNNEIKRIDRYNKMAKGSSILI